MKIPETTNYSSRISGTPGNHHKAARFDVTDGYVGITAYQPDGTLDGRVLLTPHQWETLVEFVKHNA